MAVVDDGDCIAYYAEAKGDPEGWVKGVCDGAEFFEAAGVEADEGGDDVASGGQSKGSVAGFHGLHVGFTVSQLYGIFCASFASPACKFSFFHFVATVDAMPFFIIQTLSIRCLLSY